MKTTLKRFFSGILSITFCLFLQVQLTACDGNTSEEKPVPSMSFTISPNYGDYRANSNKSESDIESEEKSAGYEDAEESADIEDDSAEEIDSSGEVEESHEESHEEDSSENNPEGEAAEDELESKADTDEEKSLENTGDFADDSAVNDEDEEPETDDEAEQSDEHTESTYSEVEDSESTENENAKQDEDASIESESAETDSENASEEEINDNLEVDEIGHNNISSKYDKTPVTPSQPALIDDKLVSEENEAGPAETSAADAGSSDIDSTQDMKNTGENQSENSGSNADKNQDKTANEPPEIPLNAEFPLNLKSEIKSRDDLNDVRLAIFNQGSQSIFFNLNLRLAKYDAASNQYVHMPMPMPKNNTIYRLDPGAGLESAYDFRKLLPGRYLLIQDLYDAEGNSYCSSCSFNVP